MRTVIVAGIAAALIVPAYAQSGSSSANGVPVGTPSKNREEKYRLDPKEVDAAYRATMKRIPAQSGGASDPWQNVRSSGDKK
jgi:hypothetical protein